jgi:hypothetical protein
VLQDAAARLRPEFAAQPKQSPEALRVRLVAASLSEAREE